VGVFGCRRGHQLCIVGHSSRKRNTGIIGGLLGAAPWRTIFDPNRHGHQGAARQAVPCGFFRAGRPRHWRCNGPWWKSAAWKDRWLYVHRRSARPASISFSTNTAQPIGRPAHQISACSRILRSSAACGRRVAVSRVSAQGARRKPTVGRHPRQQRALQTATCCRSASTLIRYKERPPAHERRRLTLLPRADLTLSATFQESARVFCTDRPRLLS